MGGWKGCKLKGAAAVAARVKYYGGLGAASKECDETCKHELCRGMQAGAVRAESRAVTGFTSRCGHAIASNCRDGRGDVPWRRWGA